MQHPDRMTEEIRNTIVALCALGALVINFWAVRKPTETKITILLWLAEFSSLAAVVAAGYFVITTDKVTLPSGCAFYNLLVQGAIFAIQQTRATRRDILSIFSAVVFFVIVSVAAATNALLNIQSKTVETDAHIISILQRLTNTPSLSPSPSPSPSNHL